MKYYCAKPSAHCASFSSKAEAMQLAVLCIYAVHANALANYRLDPINHNNITRYYVIAMDHVYA